MMRRISVVALIVWLLIPEVHAQVPRPADPQDAPIILLNGNVHVGNGEVIQNGSVAFNEGKITYVGGTAQINIDTAGYKAIDVNGQEIYPGLILPTSRVGLLEVNSLRPTRDYSEVGDINPNVRSLVAYNTDSELIATLRYNGILTAQSTPESGIFTGTSSIMSMDGWNWEDAVYKADDAIHLNWPPLYFSGSWFNPGRRENTNYEETVTTIISFLEDARAYAQLSSPTPKNLKLEAMRGLFDQSKSLFIHVNGAKEIIEACQAVTSAGIERIVLSGAADAYYVKEYIKEMNIPVILGDVHRLPTRAGEDIDMPYKLPGLLSEEGILVGLAYERGLQNSRNLPFYAGTTVAYGLSKEEALSLITINNARILGIDDQIGSLEVNKDASILVSEGDLLDMRSSRISKAFILGKEIVLEGKQEALYERFKDKYEKQGY